MVKNRSKHGIDCSYCPVQSLCIAKNVDKADFGTLNSLIKNFRDVAKGQHIVHATDTMQYLYAVYSGSCKDYFFDKNGDENIDNFYFPGDIMGLESIPNRKYFFSIKALEDSQICLIPLDGLLEVMQNSHALVKRMMNISSYKMQNDRQISNTTNATRRVAEFLLNISNRLEERKKCEDYILPMSQLDISCFLGMAHETANRILRKLQKEKIIKILNKKVVVMSIEKLNEFSLISV